MAGEKAKENKTLQSACAACGAEMSVELLRGVMVGSGRGRRIVAVCKACLDKGWDPQSAGQSASQTMPSSDDSAAS